jgi:hypothetical protein
MRWTQVIGVVAALAIGHTIARAQATPPEAAQIAEGRRLLAAKDAARADTMGTALLTQYPTNTAVLAFAIEAAIAHSGAAAGLNAYERWVHANTRDDGPALHLVARAWLREHASTPVVATKLAVLGALADDGDTDAATALAQVEMGIQGGPAGAPATRDEVITALLKDLEGPTPIRRRAIAALGQSQSARALTPLMALASDPNPDIRSAVAEALGRLGSASAITPLKTMLDDEVFGVHYQAAAALFALHDQSGLSWLRQLETSPEPGIRLAAAQATRSQPDGAWIALVRELTKVPDQEVRREAAVLLAPHDLPAARGVLTPLLSVPNVAEQDMATASLASVETDLAVLRGYLKSGRPAAQVPAAIRLLDLTR